MEKKTQCRNSSKIQ